MFREVGPAVKGAGGAGVERFVKKKNRYLYLLDGTET